MELISYLPYYMREYREINEIMSAEEREFAVLRKETEGCASNFFIDTADENGIKRFEKMLGIQSGADESLDYRRFRLKAKLTESRTNVINILDSIVSDGGWTVEYDSENYRLEVILDLENKNYMDEVYEALDRAIPANIELKCDILHTTHRALSKYRHSQLKGYRHSELQNIV